MRTLGLLVILGAVGYYALMNPSMIAQITKTTPAPPSQQEAKQESKKEEEEPQGENGDHLFEGLTG